MKVNELDVNKIFILEALDKAKDRLTGAELNCFIKSNFKSINTEYHADLTNNKLMSNLQSILSTVQEYDGILIFIEAHGSVNGITTLDGVLTWSDLNSILTDINKASALGLVVVFSCCFGVNFYKETKILNQAPYYVMIGVDDEIPEHKIIEINELLITKFANGESLKNIQDSANNIMPMIDAHLTILDAGDIFHSSFSKYLIKSSDENALKLRVINNFIEYRFKGNGVKLPYRVFKKIMFNIIMDKNYFENKFYDLKAVFLLTDKYVNLNGRFETMFDELYEKNNIGPQCEAILGRPSFALTNNLKFILDQFRAVL